MASELHGGESHHIAAGAEIHLVLPANLDIGEGDQERVPIQRQGRKALNTTVRTVVVDLIEVVLIAGFPARALPAGLADFFDFHSFSYLSRVAPFY